MSTLGRLLRGPDEPRWRVFLLSFVLGFVIFTLGLRFGISRTGHGYPLHWKWAVLWGCIAGVILGLEAVFRPRIKRADG